VVGGGGGGGGDRGSSNGKGREEGTGQIFLVCRGRVDFESVAGADQGRGWGFREGRRGKKEKFFFGGLRRIDLQGDDDERRAEMCRQQQAGIVCNLNGGGSVGPVGKRKKKRVRYGDSEKSFKKRRNPGARGSYSFYLVSSPFFPFLSFFLMAA